MASAGDGVLARSRAFLEAQVSSRSLTPQTGQGTDAVLSRMEDKLRQDDLDGVLAEAESLPSEAAAAMGDWLAAARHARGGDRRPRDARRVAQQDQLRGARMLWSLVKIVAFLAVAAALVFGLGWIIETPGEVRIAFGTARVLRLADRLPRSRVVLLVFLGIVLLKLVGLLVAVIRFLLGDETAISRHFSRSRERRGYAALSDGIIALAAGDSRTAMKKAQKADRLLAAPRPDRPPHRPGGGAERQPRRRRSRPTRRSCPTTAPAPSASRA